MFSCHGFERASFVPEPVIRERVEAAFAGHHRRLALLFPASDILHVGSTAVPGSLTKGDLDIQIRVTAGQFACADAGLAVHYQRNRDSSHSSTFSSFKDDDAEPPLGIQLTVAGGPEDFFWKLRDHLIAHPEANERYNQLKRRFEGATMTDYRAAKSDFMELLLTHVRPQAPGPFEGDLPQPAGDESAGCQGRGRG